MKKIALLLAVQLFVVTGWCLAQGTGARPTPPPITCFHFSPGVRQWSITGLYMKMGPMEADTASGMSSTSKGPTAIGFTADYSRSLPGSGRNISHGLIFSGTYMKMNIPFNFPDSANPADSLKDIISHYFGMSFGYVFVPIDGEKKDIAGEIIERKQTLALFVGCGFDGFDMNFGPLYKDITSSQPRPFDWDIIMSVANLSFPVGIVAELPLNYQFTVVPFARLRRVISATTMPTLVFLPLGHIGLYDETYKKAYTSFDYGADIDLRLFRNSPEWVISAGTVLSQVGGLKSGNLQFNVAVKREIGKHYSSTLIGPAFH